MEAQENKDVTNVAERGGSSNLKSSGELDIRKDNMETSGRSTEDVSKLSY